MYIHMLLDNCKTNQESLDLERLNLSCGKKVLFILGVLWGENGITTHLLTLSQGLQKLGWQVGLVTKLANNSPQALQQSQRAMNIFQTSGVYCYQVDNLDAKLNVSSICNIFASIAQLHRIIDDFRPSIVHLHSLSISPYIYLLQKIHKFPYLSTCHMEPKSNRAGVKMSTYFGRIVRSFLGDKIIAVSHMLRESFVKTLGVSQTKISLIPHGIDENYFQLPSLLERNEARHQWGFSEKEKIICMIGRLAPEKGHVVLMRALSSLRAEGLEINVLFAGQGYDDEEDNISLSANHLGVEDLIHLVGYSDPREVLWASDLIALPSQPQTEAFALVIAEAMLCGVVPIRTPGAGAIDQIEDGRNGYIIPFGDSEHLAKRLKEVFEDRKLLEEMSKLSFEKAQKDFTSKQMVNKTVNVYLDLIQTVGSF